METKIKKRIFLGLLVEEDDNIFKNLYAVFSDIEVRQNNEFSLCTDSNRAFSENDTDLEEYAQNYFDNMDSETQVYILKGLDCSPSEVAEALVESEGVNGLIDCSVFAEEYKVKGDVVHFSSQCGGQYDIREDLNNGTLKWVEQVISEEEFRFLMDLWDKYHLKTLSYEEYERLKMLPILAQTDEEVDAIIQNFLENHYNEYNFVY